MQTMSDHIWIYHERQQALLCGQHALNNLVQACNFSPESLAEIAHQLDEMELQYMSQNDEGGVHSKEYLARIAEVRLTAEVLQVSDSPVSFLLRP